MSSPYTPPQAEVNKGPQDNPPYVKLFLVTTLIFFATAFPMAVVFATGLEYHRHSLYNPATFDFFSRILTATKLMSMLSWIFTVPTLIALGIYLFVTKSLVVRCNSLINSLHYYVAAALLMFIVMLAIILFIYLYDRITQGISDYSTFRSKILIRLFIGSIVIGGPCGVLTALYWQRRLKRFYNKQ